MSFTVREDSNQIVESLAEEMTETITGGMQ